MSGNSGNIVAAIAGIVKVAPGTYKSILKGYPWVNSLAIQSTRCLPSTNSLEHLTLAYISKTNNNNNNNNNGIIGATENIVVNNGNNNNNNNSAAPSNTIGEAAEANTTITTTTASNDENNKIIGNMQNSSKTTTESSSSSSSLSPLLLNLENQMADMVMTMSTKDMREELKKIPPGSLVYVEDAESEKRFAVAYYNKDADIPLRILSVNGSSDNELPTIDTKFFENLLSKAQRKREKHYSKDDLLYARLVNSEGDRLSGLIVDRYNSVLSVQCTTKGMENLRPFWMDALQKLYQPAAILMKNDLHRRKNEGLSLANEIIGDASVITTPMTCFEHGNKFYFDLLHGQKTGWFYDQRANRKLMNNFTKDKRVLDCYSYVGGFGITALRNGAKHVMFIDESADALSLAKTTVSEIPDGINRTSFLKADVFNLFKSSVSNSNSQDINADGNENNNNNNSSSSSSDNPVEIKSDDSMTTAATKLNFETAKNEFKNSEFDVIIADPPAFIKDKNSLGVGLRSYQKLARELCKKIDKKNGGILFFASCSSYAKPLDIKTNVTLGIEKAGRTAKLLHSTFADKDHPPHFLMPSSTYLKAFVFEISGIEEGAIINRDKESKDIAFGKKKKPNPNFVEKERNAEIPQALKQQPKKFDAVKKNARIEKNEIDDNDDDNDFKKDVIGEDYYENSLKKKKQEKSKTRYDEERKLEFNQFKTDSKDARKLISKRVPDFKSYPSSSSSSSLSSSSARRATFKPGRSSFHDNGRKDSFKPSNSRLYESEEEKPRYFSKKRQHLNENESRNNNDNENDEFSLNDKIVSPMGRNLKERGRNNNYRNNNSNDNNYDGDNGNYGSNNNYNNNNNNNNNFIRQIMGRNDARSGRSTSEFSNGNNKKFVEKNYGGSDGGGSGYRSDNFRRNDDYYNRGRDDDRNNNRSNRGNFQSSFSSSTPPTVGQKPIKSLFKKLPTESLSFRSKSNQSQHNHHHHQQPQQQQQPRATIRDTAPPKFTGSFNKKPSYSSSSSSSSSFQRNRSGSNDFNGNRSNRR